MSDTGEADPRLAQALLEPAARAELLAAFVGARVFAAITATSTSEHVVAATGLRAESSAEMAVVLLEAQDVTRALPVFSDLSALRRWRLDARPVPLTGAQACAAALDEAAAAVLIDPAGAAVSVLELATLASGWVPVQGSGLAARHEVTELHAAVTVPVGLALALRDALRGERLREARLLEGPDGLVLGVVPKRPLTPPELAALAQRLVDRLGAALPPGGLDLAQVASGGPGRDLLARRFRWPLRT
ncbi:MAG: SseB family protein [Frankiales bacterium]|nr:SseB family protein [Frankiales bacterium]